MQNELELSVINIYKEGDQYIWIPVAKESEKHPVARAFLPENGLNDNYRYGYKAEISESNYLAALTGIQKAFVNNENKVFLVNNGAKEERQYKAKWRHGRKLNSPLLGPTKGWVKIPFTEIKNVYHKDLAAVLDESENDFAELIQFIEPVICDSDEMLASQVELLRETIANKIPKGQLKPRRISASRKEYSRDASVIAYVLNSADGICELCGKKAPFIKENGKPYLEVHHVKLLATGGTDTISNTVALCPNCHREMHYGINSLSLISDIFNHISRLEKE